jgi:outer membrane biosynthesis protein TonB
MDAIGNRVDLLAHRIGTLSPSSERSTTEIGSSTAAEKAVSKAKAKPVAARKPVPKPKTKPVAPAKPKPEAKPVSIAAPTKGAKTKTVVAAAKAPVSQAKTSAAKLTLFAGPGLRCLANHQLRRRASGRLYCAICDR